MKDDTKKELLKFIYWITDVNSPYSVMYGGTSELDKDYRFCKAVDDGNDVISYTAEEMLEEYLNNSNVS